MSDELWDKNAIGGRRWGVATQKREVCNMEIEIVTLKLIILRKKNKDFKIRNKKKIDQCKGRY